MRPADAPSGRAALGLAETLLSRPGAGAPAHAETPPRSLVSAARRMVGANLAVIGVPGEHAVAEAQQALSAGLHVFLWSDGVPLDAERALKLRARGRQASS